MTKQSLILMLCLTYSLLNYGQQVIGVSDLNPKLQIRGFIQLVAYAEDSLYIGGNVGFINDRISNPIVKVSLDGQLSESFNFDMPFSSDLFNELFQPHVLWNNRLHIQYQGEVRRINENGSFDDSFVINDAPNVQMLITHRDSLLILSNGERLALYGDDGDERIISDINTEEFGLQWLYQLDESSFLIETRERSTDNLQLRLFTNGQLDDSFEPINFTRPGAPANAERLANGEILIYGNEIVLGETQGNGIYILSADGSLSSNSPHEADLSFIDAYDNSIEIVTSDGNGKLFILGHNDPNSFANLGLAKMSLTGRRDDEFQIRSMTVEFGTRDLIPAGTGRFLLAVNQSSYDGQPSRGLNLIDIDGNAIEAFNVKTGGLPFTITSFRKINDDEFLIEGPFESSEPDGQAYLTKFSPTDGPKSTDLGFTLGVENGLGASKFLENGDFMVGFQEENTNYLKVFRDGESVEVSAQIFEPFVQRSLRSIVQTEEGIYASGSIGYNVSDTNQYGIIKLDSDYNRDETFTSPFREDEIVENVFAQDDNRLVVQTSCFDESQYKVIRLMPDGTKDETFSDIISNGASTPPVFSFSDSLFMTYDVDFNEDQRINIHDKNGEMVNQDLFRIDADRNIGDVQMISDSTFLISGNFRFVNGIPRRGIAILGTNGALYDDLDLDVVGNVSQIEIYGDTLFALGSASIDGINSGGFFAVRLITEKVEINEIVNDNDANVTLDWEMNPNIRTLEIIQSDGENEVSSGRIERDVTSYTFESTTPNVTYTYQIISRNLFGQAESSSQTYEIVQPEAPANLTAERQEELVLLNWEDLSDNETGFTIYRSADNGDFEALASTEPDVVTFTDESAVLSSAYTYVVEATSENFRSERTNEAIIDIVLSVDQDELFRIYPNPSDGIIGISSSTVIDRIEILDVSGRLLEQHQVNKTQLVRDLSGLENGVYILRIHAKNSLKTQRIILD